MFGRVKQIQHAWRMVVVIMLAAGFAFTAPGALTGAAACEQAEVQSAAVNPDYAAMPSLAAREHRVVADDVAHCCGGGSSSCAAGSGSCSSCGFAMAEGPVDLTFQDGAHLVALCARQGLTRPDPTPDCRPPRQIG